MALVLLLFATIPRDRASNPPAPISDAMLSLTLPYLALALLVLAAALAETGESAAALEAIALALEDDVATLLAEPPILPRRRRRPRDADVGRSLHAQRTVPALPERFVATIAAARAAAAAEARADG